MNGNQPITINGRRYESIDMFNLKRKRLIIVGKYRYWAIADTSILVSDSDLLSKLIRWVNIKVSEYEISGTTAFRRETRIGKSQRQTSYISESQEFAKRININRTTVQKWIREYLIGVKGLQMGSNFYDKIFSSNPQRKQIPWKSYKFLQKLVNKVSISKIGQPANIITTPSDLEEIVIKNNFRNLEIKKQHIRIECPLHGVFKKRYVDLYEGQWCRQCANEELSTNYDEIKEKGAEHGYFLEDTEDSFKKKKKDQKEAPTHANLKWTCLNTHINYKSLQNILNAARDGRYACKICYRLSIMITYKKFLDGLYNAGFKTKISKQRFTQIKKNCIKNNLILTHDVYFNITCSEGHTFPAFYNSITCSHGIRCPYCGMSFLQKRFHLYIEAALKVPFESEVDVRRIIPSETRYLIVDGYAKMYIEKRRIKVVFEVNGEQHRFFVSRFHKSPKEFHRQKERDDYEDELFRDESVVLIKIWYDDDVSQFKNLLINQFYKQTKKIFGKGYRLKNIPQYSSRILHNEFLGAKQTNQKSLKDFRTF